MKVWLQMLCALKFRVPAQTVDVGKSVQGFFLSHTLSKAEGYLCVCVLILAFQEVSLSFLELL